MFPSELLRAVVLSVATSPFDSKTTKRPLALMSVAMDRKGNDEEDAGDDVSCAAKASGFALVVWAKTEQKAPQTSVSIAMAQKELKACFTESSETKTQIGAD